MEKGRENWGFRKVKYFQDRIKDRMKNLKSKLFNELPPYFPFYKGDIGS